MSRRNVFVCGVLVFLMTLALGCIVTSAQETIEIDMCVWGMPWENALYTDIYIPEFEKLNPGIKVKFHHFEDYGTKLLTLHAGGELPDVVRQWLNPKYIDINMNLPLDRYIEGPDGLVRDDFFPWTWDAVKYYGKTWAVPQDSNMVGVLYNKTMFQEAGIALPTEDWTWDEFFNIAQKLTKKEGFRVSQYGVTFSSWYRYLLSLMYNLGGQVWTEDGTKTLINSDEAVQALEFLGSIMVEHQLAPSDDQRGAIGPDKFFEMGQAAMLFDGTWRMPAVEKNAPNLDWGMTTFPIFSKDTRQNVITDTDMCRWAINANSKHPDAAWKLIKFMSSKEALLRYWQILWVAPPARWDCIDAPEFAQIEGLPGKIPGLTDPTEFEEKIGWIQRVMSEERVSAEKATSIYWNELEERIDPALQTYLTGKGKVNAKEVLDKLAKEVNEGIARAIERGKQN